MRLRSAAPCVVIAAVLLVAGVEYSSPGAYPDPDPHNLDLLASAQPTTDQPTDSDAAFDELKTRDWDVKADVAATTSAELRRLRRREHRAPDRLRASREPRSVRQLRDRLDAGLPGLHGLGALRPGGRAVRPVEARPNNRAMAVTAACTGCRTASAAFQVVVVADRARRLSRESLAELKSWFDEQAAALRASVALPSAIAESDHAQSRPDGLSVRAHRRHQRPLAPTDTRGRPYAGRRAKRVSTEALAQLEGLVTAGLDAEAIVADVDLGH